jgi:hypothetical protein
MSRILKWTGCILVFGFLMAANPTSYVRQGSWMSSAEAIVGRPATPVSVAGVARRTTRRCIARPGVIC